MRQSALALRAMLPAYLNAPDFIIIGAQKSGTSSVFRHLSQHPAIQTGAKKEVHYFNRMHHRGHKWYKAHFPMAFARRSKSLTFEATPQYLFHPHVPQRVYAFDPNMKLIALLRNPVDRAYSQYQMMLRRGIETEKNFFTAIQADIERTPVEWEKVLKDPEHRSRDFEKFSYVAKGKYDEQISRWLEVFPTQNILIMQSETFFRDPAEALLEIWDFLSVEPCNLGRLANRNPGSYSTMPADARVFLNDLYRPHVAKLEELLQRRFSWDLS